MTIMFDRPGQHNALTFEMYDGLYNACVDADADPKVRVLVLRGVGGKAFASGTDITVFRDFRGGADGVEYEMRLTRVVNRVEEVTKPTVAAVEGFCMGGGLAIASVCDLRVATRSAKFGMPIAKTLGNCLSMNSISILVGQLGPARTLDMLLRARTLDGEQAHAAGFAAELCADDALDEKLAAIIETLLAHAPLTHWATKAAVARLRRANLPDGSDIVQRVYGSEDFGNAVTAFLSGGSKERSPWTGR